MLILEEGIRRHITEVGGNAADGQVHLGQLVGGGGLFLAVDGDVFLVALVAFHKLHGLHEHAAGAAAGVVDLAVVGLDHFRQQVNHALGGIELPAALAFGGGEFAEEVFVDAANDVLLALCALSINAAGTLINQGINVVDGVDQRRQLAGIQPQAGEVVVRQGTAQGFVGLLHGV